MSRFVRCASLVALVLGAAAPALARQNAPVRVDVLPGQVRARVPPDDMQRAEETRRQLERIMDAYSPALGQVLKLDPSLMSNGPYLAPYPELVLFLQGHPEVLRDPAYFLDFINIAPSQAQASPEAQTRWETMRMWRDFFFSITVFAGFAAAVLALGWLIRYIVGHRRWLRTVRLQSEVHGRLMERFTSNEELMAYIQSPAGRQFLQGLPAAPEIAATPAVAPPVNRILWSVQSGLVIGSAGAGLLVIREYLIEEIAEVLLVFGVLGVSLGIGFALAAGASYILSQRLGLFDATGAVGMKRE
jgi:hypothetical protein